MLAPLLSHKLLLQGGCISTQMCQGLLCCAVDCLRDSVPGADLKPLIEQAAWACLRPSLTNITDKYAHISTVRLLPDTHESANVKLTMQASEQAVEACDFESAAEGSPSEQHQVTQY